MTERKLRALCKSAYAEIDCAMNELVWAENPTAMQALSDAQELIGIILEDCSDDDVEELEFEEW